MNDFYGELENDFEKHTFRPNARNHAPKRQKMKNPNIEPSEHDIQKAFFNIARPAALQYPLLKLLFAVPNGGQRNPIVAGKLKAEGVTAGVPDVCLPVARNGFVALWIEFKRPGGKLSEPQKGFIKNLLTESHAVTVACDPIEAFSIVEKYLNEDFNAEAYIPALSKAGLCEADKIYAQGRKRRYLPVKLGGV